MFTSKFDAMNNAIQAKCQHCLGDLCDFCAIAKPWTCFQCTYEEKFGTNTCVGCKNDLCESTDTIPIVSEVKDEVSAIQKKKKNKKRKNADMIEAIGNGKRKVRGKTKRCRTCSKDFYDEYGLEEICEDCGFEGPKRKSGENWTMKLLAEEEGKKIAGSEWTVEETKLMLQLHAKKVDDEVIGRQLRRSADAVRHRREHMKLKIKCNNFR